jgi:hypothetical protein
MCFPEKEIVSQKGSSKREAICAGLVPNKTYLPTAIYSFEKVAIVTKTVLQQCEMMNAN